MLQTSIASWLRQPNAAQVSQSPTALKDQVLQSTLSHQLTARSLSASFVESSKPLASSLAAPCSSIPASLPSTKLQRIGIRPLPPNVTIEPCTQDQVNAFRRLNTLLLPIPYQDRFYHETVSDSVIASLTRIAMWHDAVLPKSPTGPSVTSAAAAPHVVAAIRCRLLASPLLDDTSKSLTTLYISTITTLSPFRRHSLATHLLATVTRTAVTEYGITSVMAHVWEANEEALEWYKRRNFTVVGREEFYYRRLAPRSAAWVVRRKVGPGDLSISM